MLSGGRADSRQRGARLLDPQPSPSATLPRVHPDSECLQFARRCAADGCVWELVHCALLQCSPQAVGGAGGRGLLRTRTRSGSSPWLLLRLLPCSGTTREMKAGVFLAQGR